MKKLLLLSILCAIQLGVMAQTATTTTAKATHHKSATAHKKKSQSAVHWKHHGNQPTTVAKDDHAAYEGKPSQSNDGVNKNKQRNINANTPTQLAPINGNGAR